MIPVFVNDTRKGHLKKEIDPIDRVVTFDWFEMVGPVKATFGDGFATLGGTPVKHTLAFDLKTRRQFIPRSDINLGPTSELLEDMRLPPQPFTQIYRDEMRDGFVAEYRAVQVKDLDQFEEIFDLKEFVPE
jgi:hypothetical protein